MKIFISCKMNGLYGDLIKIKIAKAKEYLQEKYPDAEFVDAYVDEVYADVKKHESIWYLGRSLEVLADCDAIFCCENAHLSNIGCTIEHITANMYGLQIIYDTRSEE